ncbi:hypothetical protein [Tetragenococcus koreensis]|uniref:hypothetical protein n=1 Tax=Tetragenococcus koreensis TaxID=290335 RepID=UPI001F43FEEA|nr:hypothetical protein [Tetragenococcus koreensis]MCF1626700.1 hypothetical protein [Tetragenococcus koreensis]
MGNIAQLGNIIKTLESGTRPKDREETDDIPSIGAENIERFGQYDYGSIIYDVGEKSLASFFVSENRKQVSSPVE